MISIIIPIRNEVKSIKRTIDSILYQNDMDQQIEILIADGMSHDGTREIIEDYHQNNENIHLIDNPENLQQREMYMARFRDKVAKYTRARVGGIRKVVQRNF